MTDLISHIWLILFLNGIISGMIESLAVASKPLFSNISPELAVFHLN